MMNCNIWVYISFVYLITGFILGYLYKTQNIKSGNKGITNEAINKKSSVDNTILYTSSGIDKERLEMIKEIALLNPHYRIIKKPHPLSNELSISNKPPNIIIAKSTANTYELMSSCKYLIHGASTTGIEAMLMGKIVFSINPTGVPHSGIPYGNAQINFTSPEDFTNKLKHFDEVSIRKNIDKFIKKMHPNREGNASEIIAGYCLDAIK